MKIAGRHRWVNDCVITESHNIDINGVIHFRFTATIAGWRGFVLYEGKLINNLTGKLCFLAAEIRDRIVAGDDTVFDKNGYERVQ